MLCFWGWKDETAGGMQSVIYMIAKQANSVNEKIRLYGFADSYLYHKLSKNNIQFEFYDIFIDKNILSGSFSDDDVVVITGIGQFAAELKENNPRILYWVVYKHSLREPNSFYKYHIKRNSRKILNALFLSNSVLFMDKTCADEARDYYKHAPDFKILPVPYEMPTTHITAKKSFSSQEINLTYIGRAVGWKIFPVRKMIKDLEETGVKAKLRIITDNTDIFAQELEKNELKNISVIFENHLTNEALHDYLSMNSDIHFGMGVSCLEGASLGIPTVLIDASFSDFPDTYKYKWLFDAVGYSLGDIITSKDTFKGLTLKELITTVMSSPEKRNEIGAKCFHYVQSNHGAESVYKQLKEKSAISDARINDIYSMFFINSSLYLNGIKTLFKSLKFLKNRIN